MLDIAVSAAIIATPIIIAVGFYFHMDNGRRREKLVWPRCSSHS